MRYINMLIEAIIMYTLTSIDRGCFWIENIEGKSDSEVTRSVFVEAKKENFPKRK